MPTKRRSTGLRWFILLLVLGAAGGGGWWWQEKQKVTFITVQTEKVSRRNLTEVVVATGKIQPVTLVKISPEVSGEITALPVKEGQPVKKGESGALWIRSESAAKYYWNKPDKTAETMVDGWLNTGDTYRQDEDGYFIYEGRSDDMLKVGGIWCSPRAYATATATMTGRGSARISARRSHSSFPRGAGRPST